MLYRTRLGWVRCYIACVRHTSRTFFPLPTAGFAFASKPAKSLGQFIRICIYKSVSNLSIGFFVKSSGSKFFFFVILYAVLT